MTLCVWFMLKTLSHEPARTEQSEKLRRFVLLQVRFHLALKSSGSNQVKPDISVQRMRAREKLLCEKTPFHMNQPKVKCLTFFPPAIKASEVILTHTFKQSANDRQKQG